VRKDLAERIIRDVLAFSGKLDQSVAAISGSVEEDFFNQHRLAVGRAMGLLYIEILRDLFQQYPELEPESMR